MRTLRTHPLAVTETGHYTELLYDDGEQDRTVVCAAHGGAVEPGTAEGALELALETGGTCWACLGYETDGDAFEQWHPASTAIDPGDYPLLEGIAGRGFDTVVSLHGLADEAVLVGGGLEADTKELVARRLREAVDVPVETVEEGEYAGAAPGNFVNWLAADGAGLQIEAGPGVRAAAGDAVVATLGELVGAGRLG